MMAELNCFKAFAAPVYGGYNAMVRTAKDAKAKPITGKGGAPLVYRTELEALRAATDGLTTWINGHMERTGEVAGATAAAANAAFTIKTVEPRRRQITVITKRKAVRVGQDRQA